MFFKDNRQRARACKALLLHIGRAELWSDEGPTKAMASLEETEFRGISKGEAIMMKAAYAVWNTWNNGPRLDEMIAVLDDVNLARVGRLLVALGEPDDRELERFLGALNL